MDEAASLKHTPLHALHLELGARMVPFAGYDMPVQYPAGILAEHLHTRAKAGLFDVSHMGQVRLHGGQPAQALETLVPGNIAGLEEGRIRYTLFTGESGGILDDLTVGSAGDHLTLVVNAARKEFDYAHLRAHLVATDLEVLEDRALLALQGPMAAAVLTRYAPAAGFLVFMSFAPIAIHGIPCMVARAGYTGEDGYEISVAADRADELAHMLLDEPEVEPAGLGARDSLRLESGLCLYGHDLDETTTPVEGGLGWTIPRERREQGGFPGAAVIRRQLEQGAARKRVGILPEGKAPAREGTVVIGPDGKETGVVTSGGFGPSVGGPVAMGYVAPALATVGTELGLVVRGTTHAARVVKLPFVPHRYFKG